MVVGFWKNTDINVIQVSDPFRAEVIIIRKPSYFIGPFSVKNGQLDNVTVTSDNATFINTQVKNITIKNRSDGKAAKVRLDGQTKVAGNIVLDVGNSQVVLQDTAKLVGKVIAGTIANK